MNFPPIQIAASSSASPASSLLSSWAFDPAVVNIQFTQGQSLPVTTLEVTPPDYGSNSAYSDLSNFRAEITIINTGNWLNFANNTTEEFQNFTSSSFTKDLILINTGTLNVGSYNAQVKFDVIADDQTGATVFVESKYKTIGLTVLASPVLTVNNDTFDVSVALNSTGTGNFGLNITSNTNWDITNATNGLNFSTLTGSGNGQVTFSVASSITFSSSGAQIFTFDIESSASTVTVTLNVDVVSSVNEVDISQLNIYQAFGYTNPIGSFNIITSENYTISAPVWLQLSSESGSSSAVINWAVGNNPLGVYNAFMTITFDTSSIDIPISYNVTNFLNLSAIDSGINYTRSNKVIKFLTASVNNTFVRLVINIGYGYGDDSFAEGLDDSYTLTQEIGFFNNRASFDIGEYCETFFWPWIHPSQLLEDFPAHSYGEALKFTEISPQVQEVEFNTNNIITDITLDPIEFVRGNDKEGLLNIVREKSSIVNGGFAVVNVMLTQNENFKWHTGSYIYNSGFTTFTSFPRLATFLWPVNSTADIVQFSIGGDEHSFIVRPEVFEPITVFFYNEHHLLECITFRDGFQLDSDYSYRFSSNRTQFINTQKSKFYEETIPISLSTGGLLKNDITKVKQLLRCEQATMYFRGKEYFINPVNQKLPFWNSTRNIHSFSIKFNMSKEDYDSII